MSGAEEDDELATMRRTLDACAWLFPVAEAWVNEHGWPPAILAWLEQLGSGIDQKLKALH